MRADRRLNRASAPPQVGMDDAGGMRGRNIAAVKQRGNRRKEKKTGRIPQKVSGNEKQVVANSIRRRVLRMQPLDSATGELANCWVEKIRTGRGSNPWTAVDHTWFSSQAMTLRQIRRRRSGARNCDNQGWRPAEYLARPAKFGFSPRFTGPANLEVFSEPS